MSRQNNTVINTSAEKESSLNLPMSCYLLSAINASGTASAALYNAVVNNALFSKPSLTPITIDASTTASYLQVELDILQDLEIDERMMLMVEHLIAEAKNNLTTTTPFSYDDIKQVWVVSHLPHYTDQQNKNSVREWQQNVQNKLKACFAQPDTLSIRFVTEQALNDIFTLSEPVLLLMVDSFHSPECVAQLKSAHKIQVVDGKPGLVVGEGAICALLVPQSLLAPSHDQNTNVMPLSIESFNPEQKLSLNEQLKQAEVSVEDVFVHVGINDEAWIKTWYQQSHYLVTTNEQHQIKDLKLTMAEQGNFLTLYTPNSIVGYAGAADFFTGLYFAQAWLQFPLHHSKPSASIYVIANHVVSSTEHSLTPSLYRLRQQQIG